MIATFNVETDEKHTDVIASNPQVTSTIGTITTKLMEIQPRTDLSKLYISQHTPNFCEDNLSSTTLNQLNL